MTEARDLNITNYIIPTGEGGADLRGSEEAVNDSRGVRAVVGGVDYAVGGWGEYEITRRRAQWEATRGGAACGARYPRRTYISADDAARSVLAASRTCVGGGRAAPGEGKGGSALQKAAIRLAQALARLEDKLCSPDEDGVWECVPEEALRGRGDRGGRELLTVTVPAMTSADLREFASSPEQESDPDALEALGDDVISLAAALDLALPPLPVLQSRLGRGSAPPLPARMVPISDDEAILRLEAAVAPYVTHVESIQAALASRLDATATALLRRLGRPAD